MLIRNCVPNLFKAGDRNVRATYFDNHPADYEEADYKNVWLDTIRDSLGNGIVCSSTSYSVEISTQCTTACLSLRGEEITNFINKCFRTPISIRIDIYSFSKMRSWIVFVVPGEKL